MNDKDKEYDEFLEIYDKEETDTKAICTTDSNNSSSGKILIS